ncbi:hypothetical protein Salat_1422800 [Sesamum alatum]|uniref:Uncharacterized protein n=1 Tax=Sesamum alatum TaxID=300844 RepID=A0AAE2CLG4_9LAMI|nr:hypothetical protein Salat_1422800 [Sesamum alatum]
MSSSPSILVPPKTLAPLSLNPHRRSSASPLIRLAAPTHRRSDAQTFSRTTATPHHAQSHCRTTLSCTTAPRSATPRPSLYRFASDRLNSQVQVRVDLTGKETEIVFEKTLRNLARTAPPFPGFRREKGGMTRGSAPPGRGRGRGRGRGQVVRPPNLDAYDAPKASTHPIAPPPGPPSVPTTSRNPSVDPTPRTSQASGSSDPSPSLSSTAPPAAAPPPAAPPRPRRFIRGDDVPHKRTFHSCIGDVVSGHYTHPWPSYREIPESQKNFWFDELKRIYRWDCPDETVRSFFNPYAGKWIIPPRSSAVDVPAEESTQQSAEDEPIDQYPPQP